MVLAFSDQHKIKHVSHGFLKIFGVSFYSKIVNEIFLLNP
jgi:hypothetical protein